MGEKSPLFVQVANLPSARRVSRTTPVPAGVWGRQIAERWAAFRSPRPTIGVLAELERSLISERTRAGVKAAQRRGVKFGRNLKLTPDRLAHARKLIDQGRSPTEAAKIIGIARATIYRALQREGT